MDKVKKMKKQNKEQTAEIIEIDVSNNDVIKAVFVEAVLMPNGEIIRFGKTIEWNKKAKGVYERLK